MLTRRRLTKRSKSELRQSFPTQKNGSESAKKIAICGSAADARRRAVRARTDRALLPRLGRIARAVFGNVPLRPPFQPIRRRILHVEPVLPKRLHVVVPKVLKPCLHRDTRQDRTSLNAASAARQREEPPDERRFLCHGPASLNSWIEFL